MIRVWIDDNGFIREWTTASTDDSNAIEIDYDPMKLIEDDCRLFKLDEGKLVKHEERIEEIERDDKVAEIRARREEECFSVINRGGLWYEMLSDAQRDELLDWYSLWLDATETLKIPNKPSWLEEGGDELVL